MKRLLQRVQDGLYYQGPGTWTKDPELAFVFPKTAAAIECCLQEGLPPMQVVLKFEDSNFDIKVPCWSPEKAHPSKAAAQTLREQLEQEGH